LNDDVADLLLRLFMVSLIEQRRHLCEENKARVDVVLPMERLPALRHGSENNQSIYGSTSFT
jgi:hypothetical protein